MRRLIASALAIALLASYAFAETVGVCNLPSAATVQVRIYDITDTAEDVAWTATGVTERANGQGKSCYYYSATLEAGHSYQVDWKDDSSPVKTAGQVLSGMETSINAILSTRSDFNSASDQVTVATNNDKTGYTVSTVQDKTGYEIAGTKTRFDDLNDIAASDVTGGTTVAQAESNIRGADNDTLKTVSDQVDTAQADLDNAAQYKANVSNLDAAVSSRLAASAYTAPDNASIAAIQAQTDKLQFDGDNYALTNAVAGGGAVGASAAEVWAYGARTLTDKTGFSLTMADKDDISDRTWDEPLAGHLGAGSTGSQLNSAASAGNPWASLVTANQEAGSFGALMNTISVTQTGNIGTGVLQYLVTVTDSSRQQIVRGDTKAFTFNLGSSWDLTGKKVYFIAKADRDADNSTAIVNREATVTDAANGVATITLTPSETSAVGTYYAEVEVRDSDDTNPRTARQFRLNIVQDVRQ